MYRAFINRDSTFEGIFVAAVRTTGIFCRPACPARKPRRENIEFYASAGEAMERGYRPCRVCRPLVPLGENPDWVKALFQEIESNPGIRIKDLDLENRGVDPALVRRWFRKNYRMTFQAYLRAMRMGKAFDLLRSGEKVIDAAFDSGYESLAGFTESFKKTTGFSPNKSSRNRLITVTRMATPLGPVLAGALDEGVCLLEFMDPGTLETQATGLKKTLKAEMVPGYNRFFEPLQRELDEYFAGKRKEFDLPLVMLGTDFQQEVWRALMAIPYGETRSYQEQAASIGKPASVRAVAAANGDNRISIIIPCHRVIGKDGSLTGYGGGLWRKRYLLDLESGQRKLF
jgi:AraC family transcriptional regulator of adaptative response/methylated-DNA-[protein]-cysteine methyltransferase